MHYKKRKLHKLHSIPIGLCNNINRNKRLYLVSYSIPLSCMVVLFLTGIFAINPSLSLKTSAVTIQDEWVVKDPDEADEEVTESNTQNADVTNTNGNDNDSGIMPFSIGSTTSPVATPSISLGIAFGTGSNGGAVDQIVNTTQGGDTVYRSHNVIVTATSIKDYTLTLSGPTNLTPPSGASDVVGGANGRTGSNLAANTWGYAWGNTTDTDSNMTYNSLSSSGKPLTGESITSDNGLNFTKKLVFAAKFGDVTPGNYTAEVKLSAVATPLVMVTLGTWSNGTSTGIARMQDVDSAFVNNYCKSSSIPVGNTIYLQDDRSYDSTLIDNDDGTSRYLNTYRIVKLRDDNCWMQENLRLKLTKNTTVKGSTSSGGAYSWTVPNQDGATTQASSATTWTSDNSAVMSRMGTTANGNYYTWCAATAGTCSSATSAGAVASASICPKGWKLPTGNTAGDFYTLLNGVGSHAATQSPYYYPYAGYIANNGSYSDVGSRGGYWSSTAYSGAFVYYLNFYSGGFYPGTGSGAHYIGFSVRCVTGCSSSWCEEDL